MDHQLSLITKEHVLRAFETIDTAGIPKDNQWNEYWIAFRSKLYPFKYTVEVASSFTSAPLETTDFRSNDSSRRYIAALGFNIQFKSQTDKTTAPRFWVGATYFGVAPNQQDMFADFRNNDYWKTDHYLDSGTGLGIYNLLKKVKINDRLALRYFSRKNGTTDIIAIGTVTGITQINEGRLDIVWDINPPLYRGKIPDGEGAGNWWTTFFELKRQEDLYVIFGYGATSERIARLTWNDNGYVSPSGLIGKSKDKKTHEGTYGYGHEEWLFDTSKLVDGYHYGFLEPIRKHQNAYTGKDYDVWLYTIDANSGLRYLVGKIKNVEVINSEEAARIKILYEQNGWLGEMDGQIRSSGANAKGFSGYSGLDIFNIRYRPENLEVNDPYFELPPGHPMNSLTRYSLAFMKEKYRVDLDKTEDDSPFIFIDPTDTSTPTTTKPRKKSTVRAPKAVEIIYLHKAISENLTAKLREKYGVKNVKPEHPAGYGQNRIDIVVRHGKELIFFEIKTYNSLTTSIREALGQLFE